MWVYLVFGFGFLSMFKYIPNMPSYCTSEEECRGQAVAGILTGEFCDAGHLSRHRAHYDVTVMIFSVHVVAERSKATPFVIISIRGELTSSLHQKWYFWLESLQGYKQSSVIFHDEVMKHFPHYWPLKWGDADPLSQENLPVNEGPLIRSFNVFFVVNKSKFSDWVVGDSRLHKAHMAS